MAELIKKRDFIKEEGLIKEVDEMSVYYDAIERVIFKTSYLADLTQDVIFEAYKEVVQADHKR